MDEVSRKLMFNNNNITSYLLMSLIFAVLFNPVTYDEFIISGFRFILIIMTIFTFIHTITMCVTKTQDTKMCKCVGSFWNFWFWKMRVFQNITEKRRGQTFTNDSTLYWKVTSFGITFGMGYHFSWGPNFFVYNSDIDNKY